VTAEADVDVEVEQPHAVHHRLGDHWLDKVLPISAILISVISIWIAFHHGQVMQELVHQNERLVQASSLPHLTLSSSFMTDGQGRSRASFGIVNGGVGPAEIRTAELLLDGRPVRNASDLLAKCCGITSSDGLVTSAPTNSMVRAGQSIDYFSLTQVNDAAKSGLDRLYWAIEQDRIVARTCYCSVFDECWVRSSRDERPRRVKQCPPVAVSFGR
jgi:hypothetical protein